MSVLAIDANIVVKWFMPEADSDRALLILDSFVSGDCRLIAPDLMLIEFGNVLWKRRDILDEDTSLDMISDFLALGIRLVPSERIIARAYSIARQHDRSLYDSLYISLADSEGCDLVTADQHLFNAVQRELPFVRWLGEWQLKETG